MEKLDANKMLSSVPVGIYPYSYTSQTLAEIYVFQIIPESCMYAYVEYSGFFFSFIYENLYNIPAHVAT